MKTVDELIHCRLPKEGGGWTRMTYQELKKLIEETQQDAFSDGWDQGMRDCNDMISKGLNVHVALGALRKEGLNRESNE